MSLSNQNSILAHRSIYGNQSQSSSSSTEFKIVSIKKNPPTPRRISAHKTPNNVTYFNEKSHLLLEISILRDEISQLNQILDEKKKGFSSSELATIFYLNKDLKQTDTTNSIYQETATLDKQIDDLKDIFDSDSIIRLNESNENHKILLREEQEKYENEKVQIQAIQKRIKKLRDSDIHNEILEQRKKISEQHKQIHDAVEIHRKLKEELRKVELYDPSKIKKLENTLLKAQEKKAKAIKKYKSIRKHQQKERIEVEAEKLRRKKKFVISTVTQSFEFCGNNTDKEDSIQKSIVSYEKLFNEAEDEAKVNSISYLNHEKSKNYIQENGILIDSDFEIATKLLSENEEDSNPNNLIIEEEEEDDEIKRKKPRRKKSGKINSNDQRNKKAKLNELKNRQINSRKPKIDMFENIQIEDENDNEKENKIIQIEDKNDHGDDEKEFKDGESDHNVEVKENDNVNKEEEDTEKDEVKHENEQNYEEKIKSESEKAENQENDDLRKVEFVHNSIQCELFTEPNDNQEIVKKDTDSHQVNEIENQAQDDDIPSFLFPPESEIESTSIVYSESDFSSSQIENFKKERKEKERQNKILNDQINTENEKVKNDALLEYSSSYENKKERNIDFQSESTSICNSSIDSGSFSDNINNSSISNESTSIITSASDFKFADLQKSFSNRETKSVKQELNLDFRPFHYENDIRKKFINIKDVEENIISISESNELTSGEPVILETSKPITFESPEISSQLQMTTEGEHTEYTEYLSSQLSENESEIEVDMKMNNEVNSNSNSIVSDFGENGLNLKNFKPNLINNSTKKSDEKTALRNQMGNVQKHHANSNQNKFDEFISSISSSQEKIEKTKAKKIALYDIESSSSQIDMQERNDKHHSSNCRPDALISASDNHENFFKLNQKNIQKTDSRSQEKEASLLSNRRDKKYSDQSDRRNFVNINEIDDENNNIEEVLDNKFVAEDDRNVLKVGSFQIKPSKKKIMPYFVSFGTVNSYQAQQENSKYIIYIGFKKHSAAKNAKKSLNGSKIEGTRLKISWESESNSSQSVPKSSLNFKSSKSHQNAKPKDVSIYKELICSSSSS